MNIFQMIGPIMIGPSSSHTAGAVRLGRVANKLMNGSKPVKVDIELSGSFARTYKGHGTDRAILAGIMGYHSYSVEIRDALNIATKEGIDYRFIPNDIPNAHPNTARITFKCEDGTEGVVEGASIGGGSIRVDYVNGMKVDFTGEYNTILVMHNDTPGVIAGVTSLIHNNYEDVNIGNFKLSRKEKGSLALMTIEIDNMPPKGMIEEIAKIPYVKNAVLIRAI
jgi:L-serine dehydratase, iron-sulfur-dependent, beta subunit